MIETPDHPIQLLPEHLIDQIKAGEVVERPANVLKELLENSLDAGADRIDVEIKDNGLNLLRISDNGHGIRSHQLELAFCRHTTSKIQHFDDLYRLHTYGFRGEALAAVASIARVECVSWNELETQGAVLRLEGGLSQGVQLVEKISDSHGTIITVQDLFFNTPVRLKFIQSSHVEKNWLKRFFYAFVIANPQVQFSITWDEQDRLIYPIATDISQRVQQLFSQRQRDKLHLRQASRSWNEITCEVTLIYHNGLRPEGPLEHVVINGRPVLDKSYPKVIQQTLLNAAPQEIPETFVVLKVPANQIDVNIHPNKTSVKTHQTQALLSLLSSTLRDALPQSESVHLSSEWISSLHPSVDGTTDLATVNDLSSDRSLRYSQQLERLQGSTNLSNARPEGSPGILLHATVGPFFLWQITSSQKVFYVDGTELLSYWVKRQATPVSARIPLLVSHPLREIKLSEEDLRQLLEQGFEIDRLDGSFFVVREIPLWSQGIPLSPLLAFMLQSAGHALQETSFTFHEISFAKWWEIWTSESEELWLQKKIAREISPLLFSGQP